MTQVMQMITSTLSEMATVSIVLVCIIHTRSSTVASSICNSDNFVYIPCTGTRAVPISYHTISYYDRMSSRNSMSLHRLLLSQIGAHQPYFIREQHLALLEHHPYAGG